ncbi:MAG: hypothetical protein IJS13_06950 [Paludibacteraceae bacterium]|nr:hypothetical protein [Paludibacteraceae bacterium]
MNARELINYAKDRFAAIENMTIRLTSGNVSHHAATIGVYAKNTAEYIEIEMQDSGNAPIAVELDMLQMSVGWFRDIADLASRLTTGNVSHMGCTIRGKALRCKEYLNKHM